MNNIDQLLTDRMIEKTSYDWTMQIYFNKDFAEYLIQIFLMMINRGKLSKKIDMQI